MPHLQKLYERFQNAKDVQVITFNVDDDEALARAFVQQKHFTFPSLIAERFFHQNFRDLGTPLTWVVDATGIIRIETWGFSGDGEKWTAQTLSKIERVKSRTEPAR